MPARRRFRLPFDPAQDFCVYDLNADEVVDPARFASKGRATPFAGMRVAARCMLTVCAGRVVYCHPDFPPLTD